MKHFFQSLAVVIGTLSASVRASEPTCPAQDSDNFYFRPGTFGTKDDFTRQWYSSQLRAMNEPSMWCGDSEGTRYRFTWLRTFHHPIAVRVTSKGGVARMEAVELDGAGGYEPGKELRRVSRPISTEDWLSIKQAMDAWDPKVPAERRGVDGAEWIFERSTSSGYSAISVQSPTSGPARSIGESFLAKAEIVVPSDENY